MPQGPSWDWGGFEGSVIRKSITIENIYRFFQAESLWPHLRARKGPHGDQAIGDVLTGAGRAIRCSAAAKGAGAAEDASGGKVRLECGRGFSH